MKRMATLGAVVALVLLVSGVALAEIGLFDEPVGSATDLGDGDGASADERLFDPAGLRT
jgi:hypothetical protein